MTDIGHTWTISVGGTLRDWKDIEFTRSLKSDPQEFSATLDYVSGINYWDAVLIKSDNVLEWYGYVEHKDIMWDSGSRYLKISGRCRKVILWKKWVERMTETRLEGGFFGSVHARRLLEFLLRTPVSDDVHNDDGSIRLNHKVGWGLAPENWEVRASPTVASTEKEWVKSRFSGLVWRNRGDPFKGTTRDVNGHGGSGTHWTHEGDSPYIHNDGDEPDDGDKIHTKTNNAYCEFDFENLEASATGINDIWLYFYYKSDSRGLFFWYKAEFDIYVWRNSTSEWVWVANLLYHQPSWRQERVNIKSAVSTVADVNAIKVKFVNKRTQLEAHITYAWLSINYTTSGSQEIGDYFVVDLDESTDIMGMLIECRKNSDQYARNYSIQYSNADDPDPTDDGDWSDFASGAINVTDNTYRDILHSWRPTTLKHIRIKITVQNTSYGWEISQIYVWKAEPKKYRAYLDGLSQPPAPPPYQGGPYIYDMAFDTSYNVSIGGINIPYCRLIDALEAVKDRCHQDYVPFEWWLEMSDGTIKFEDHKGSDKSGSIAFVKGTHLGGSTWEGDVKNTIQRARVVGKSEDKKQDEISSSWEENTTEMDNIRGFYEEILSGKTVSDKEVADFLANLHVTEMGPEEELLTCEVENDPYSAMAYDVGDDVTITDALIGVADVYRIYTIRKKIDADGEHITLYLGSCWEDVSDEWAKVNKRLRELELTGTVISDWFAEGAGQSKMKDEETTESFEKNARNDEEEAPSDDNDPKWTIDESAGNGVDFSCGDRWFKFNGTNAGDAVTRTVSAYINEPTVELDQNPKLVCEVKIDTSGDYDPWEDGDNFVIWFGKIGTPWKGFGFEIRKEGAVYELRGQLHDNVDYRDVMLGNLLEDVKYRLEAVCDWDSRVIKYYLQDPNSATGELELIALLQISEECAPNGFNFYPLAMQFYTTSSVGGQQARILIYKFRSEWKARQ